MAISYRAAQTIIKRGDEPALRAALDAGLDPNLANQNGWSLLMLAAVENATELGRLLLERGADPAKITLKKETARDLAAKKNFTAFVELIDQQQVRKS